MPKTDLDWLCKGASPEEVKRLMRLVHEWTQGDENSFPVQLALLTRAQWRAATMIPQLVNESRELMELKLAEHRQQNAALVQQFSDTADAKIEAVSAIVAQHTEAMNQAVAKVQVQLTNTESVAAHIRNELETGTIAWKQARADYEAERQKLEETRRELDTRTTRRDWLWVGLVLLGMIALGIVIGMAINSRLAH
jgi:vacuolar-type H+-ATPase subunit I/STV1